MIDVTILAPALALGVYMAVVVLPLFALLWLAHGGLDWVSHAAARQRGSLGGTLTGMGVGLALALMSGAVAPRAMLWTLIVAVPLLAFAGAAAGIRAATALRARPSILAYIVSANGTNDRHEAA